VPRLSYCVQHLHAGFNRGALACKTEYRAHNYRLRIQADLRKFEVHTEVYLTIGGFFYSKTNQMHNISNLFYFGTTFYILHFMFLTVFPSIIRSLRLYLQHQVYVIQVLWLLASKQPQNLYGMMLYVQC
jgi:hypothetical protein